MILDWTPAHFPKDAFALGRFDGSALYEHLDPRKGEHKQWNTYVFNYGRPEVKNFLISNALFWIDEFHVDGLRVDAVASMLYLDYGASHPGEWVPNKYGGRENLDAVAFLRELNERVHAACPGAILAAEESTSWPGVTRPPYVGGLGFDFKWNMGWMHDTLDYFKFDPIFRAYHHGKLTFSIWYAFTERFLLPLSHDEVVHLKKSMLSKMPGDAWQMHANLRALYAYMWAHPGKKLLFMGGEIGQWREWNFEGELDWFVLDEPLHQGLLRVVRDLNRLYQKLPALYELDDEAEGFRWIDCNDAPNSVIAFVRFPSFVTPKGRKGKITTRKGVHVVTVCNLTPLPRLGYRIGVPRRCAYLETLNTDAREYGGSGMGNLGRVEVEDVPSHGFPHSVVLTLPPLATLWLTPELDEDPLLLPEGTEAEKPDSRAGRGRGVFAADPHGRGGEGRAERRRPLDHRRLYSGELRSPRILLSSASLSAKSIGAGVGRLDAACSPCARVAGSTTLTRDHAVRVVQQQLRDAGGTLPSLRGAGHLPQRRGCSRASGPERAGAARSARAPGRRGARVRRDRSGFHGSRRERQGSAGARDR